MNTFKSINVIFSEKQRKGRKRPFFTKINHSQEKNLLKESVSIDSRSRALKFINDIAKYNNVDANGYLISEDSRVVSLPLILLQLAFPNLSQLLVGNHCFDHDVSIYLPCRYEICLLLKSLICAEDATIPTLYACEFLNILNMMEDIFSKKDVTCIDQVPESFEPSVSEDNSRNLEYVNLQVDPLELSEDLHAIHCSRNCLNKCSEAVKSWPDENILYLKGLSQSDSKISIKNNLMQHLQFQGKVNGYTDSFLFFGHSMCLKYLSFITSISEYILDRVLKDFKNGRLFYTHGNRGVIRLDTIAISGFKAWFTSFLKLYGQHAPDEEVVVLSHWLNKKLLYQIYKSEAPLPHIALTTFYQHLISDFGPKRQDMTLPCVRFSSYSSHSVCDICVALNANQKACKNETDLIMAQALRNQHKMDYGMARKAIEEIRQSAVDFPDDNLFIQADGIYYFYYYRKIELMLKE